MRSRIRIANSRFTSRTIAERENLEACFSEFGWNSRKMHSLPLNNGQAQERGGRDRVAWRGRRDVQQHKKNRTRAVWLAIVGFSATCSEDDLGWQENGFCEQLQLNWNSLPRAREGERYLLSPLFFSGGRWEDKMRREGWGLQISPKRPALKTRNHSNTWPHAWDDSVDKFGNKPLRILEARKEIQSLWLTSV